MASRIELRRFAEEADFALADENRQPWDEYMTAFHKEWELLGRWVPAWVPAAQATHPLSGNAQRVRRPPAQARANVERTRRLR